MKRSTKKIGLNINHNFVMVDVIVYKTIKTKFLSKSSFISSCLSTMTMIDWTLALILFLKNLITEKIVELFLMINRLFFLSFISGDITAFISKLFYSHFIL